MPEIEVLFHEPTINAINKLKKEKNAIILAHNYQRPEIYHGVADIVGDSLALAKEAKNTDADVIVMAGVHFMAETAKLMSPNKIVLMPNMEAGCSLADSITVVDIELLREKYPDVPVVTYVNTSAEVKAASDITCTSGNAVEVIESLGVGTVIMIPDEYLAKWVATQTSVKIIAWKGHCEVHEKFTAEQLNAWRNTEPGLVIIAHPECSPEVLKAADFVGSTAKMSDYVKDNQPKKVLMVTECSMSDNVSVENPNVEFVRPCNLCPHMKKITLDNILHSLETMEPEVKIAPEIISKARESVERMMNV